MCSHDMHCVHLHGLCTDRVSTLLSIHIKCKTSAWRCSGTIEACTACEWLRPNTAALDHLVVMLQIENYDQTTTGALAHWDDHASLAEYDFASDGLAAPENDDEKRKLAYRWVSFRCIALLPCLAGLVLHRS